MEFEWVIWQFIRRFTVNFSRSIVITSILSTSVIFEDIISIVGLVKIAAYTLPLCVSYTHSTSHEVSLQIFDMIQLLRLYSIFDGKFD